MKMFCYQCEQAAKGTGCDESGVCGKKPEISLLQDAIVFQLRGIAFYAAHVYQNTPIDRDIAHFVCKSLFTTVTNVNFDTPRLEAVLNEGNAVMETLKNKSTHTADTIPPAAHYHFDSHTHSVNFSDVTLLNYSDNEDVRSLQHIILYGLKGMAAYADHAAILGKEDDTVYRFFIDALNILNQENATIEQLVNMAMKCGEHNITVMQMLDAGHTEHFGNPEPTTVSTGLKKGPAIIVTGHDLLDLYELLKQTEGSGISIYTHGEMLPAHGYPKLKQFSHLVGHFGTAWQNQQKEFDGIHAAILFTTNCIQKPKDSYIDRVFTTGLVAYPGVSHIKTRNFSSLIEKAKMLGGFEQTDGRAHV